MATQNEKVTKSEWSRNLRISGIVGCECEFKIYKYKMEDQNPKIYLIWMVLRGSCGRWP